MSKLKKYVPKPHATVIAVQINLDIEGFTYMKWGSEFDTLGDIVLLEGFLKSLQELYPQAQLVLLVRKGYESLSPLFPKSIEWMTTDIDPFGAFPDTFLCEKLTHELTTGKREILVATSYSRTWADVLVAARVTDAKRVALGEP